MTDKPTERDVNAAQMDAQAFGLTAAFSRLKFVKDLVSDPATSVFSKDVVRWLVQALENERSGRGHDQTALKTARDRIAELEARQPMPKGKAIVKLAKVVARQAEAITDIVQTVDADQSGAPEWEAIKDKHADTIEAASYGD